MQKNKERAIKLKMYTEEKLMKDDKNLFDDTVGKDGEIEKSKTTGLKNNIKNKFQNIARVLRKSGTNEMKNDVSMDNDPLSMSTVMRRQDSSNQNEQLDNDVLNTKNEPKLYKSAIPRFNKEREKPIKTITPILESNSLQVPVYMRGHKDDIHVPRSNKKTIKVKRKYSTSDSDDTESKISFLQKYLMKRFKGMKASVRRKLRSYYEDLVAKRARTNETDQKKIQFITHIKTALKPKGYGPWELLWEYKQERFRKESPYGDFSSYRIRQVIVKGGDDLRQEMVAMQIIKKIKLFFEKENTNLFLRVYDIIAIDSNSGALGNLPLSRIRGRFYIDRRHKEEVPRLQPVRDIQTGLREEHGGGPETVCGESRGVLGRDVRPADKRPVVSPHTDTTATCSWTQKATSCT